MSNSSCYLKQKKASAKILPQFHRAFTVYFFCILNLFPISLLYFPLVCCFCPLQNIQEKIFQDLFLCCLRVVFLPVGRLLPILPSFEVHLLCSCDVTDLQYLSTMCLSISVPVNVCLFLTARGAGVSTGYQLKTKLTI